MPLISDQMLIASKSWCAAAIVVMGTSLSCHPVQARLRPDRAFVAGEIGSSKPGQRVQGATVHLLTADRVSIDSAIVDARGRVLLGPVAPGSYRLRVRLIAHRTTFREVRLDAGAIDTVRIVLKYDTTGLIEDCIGPDGWSFGSQFCEH